MFDGVMLQADAVVSWAGRLLGNYPTCNGPDKVAASKPKPVRLPWQAPWSERVTDRRQNSLVLEWWFAMIRAQSFEL